MQENIMDKIKNLTMEQRSLLLRKCKLELAKKDICYFIQTICPEFSIKFIKEMYNQFENSDDLRIVFKGRKKFVGVEKTTNKNKRKTTNGLFIIDDEIESDVEKTQDQLKVDWQFFSNLQITPQSGSIVRWAENDLVGKMLNGETK